jgi:hypothetical protein
MFPLFKTRRHSRLLTNEKILSRYLEIMKEFSDHDLAKGLDIAAEIKFFLLKSEITNSDYWDAFHEPIKVNEKTAESIRTQWVDILLNLHDTEHSQSLRYAMGMSIWVHSLLSAAYPELRHHGLALWEELQRGFKYCTQFVPKRDVPEVI